MNFLPCSYTNTSTKYFVGYSLKSLLIWWKDELKLHLFLFQGLFHPARKVRDVYWKIYNNLYIGSQDALVAGFPRIANDAKNTYVKYELDYVL